MRFEVPQFIDVEDKIFGPLTWKQFLYLAGGGGLAYVSFRLIPFPFWVIPVAIFVAIGLALAFYKLNKRPFIEVAQNWLTYQFKGKLYIWNRAPLEKKAPVPIPKPPAPPQKIVTAKTVTDLAQNLDVLDTYRQ